jgi:hemerythrin-like domain-containing protein
MTVLSATKRQLVCLAGLTGAGLVTSVGAPAIIVGPAHSQEKAAGGQSKGNKEEVTPPEDLMREHGVLDRVLLIYEASIRRISGSRDFDPAVVTHSAEIIRDFINNYHEKSEEEQVFPRFKQAGQMVDLVDTLLRQHEAGRNVTQTILQYAPSSRKDEDDRRRVLVAMQSFITMYRPHAAREDTVLFPKLSSLVSSNEYDAMAEEFEKKERQLFGEDGFEKVVARVAQIEQQLGIYDLNQFTPH